MDSEVREALMMFDGTELMIIHDQLINDLESFLDDYEDEVEEAQEEAAEQTLIHITNMVSILRKIEKHFHYSAHHGLRTVLFYGRLERAVGPEALS